MSNAPRILVSRVISRLILIALTTIFLSCGGGGSSSGSQSGEFVLVRSNSIIPTTTETEAVFFAEGVVAFDANSDGLPDILRPISNFDKDPELPLEIYLNLGGGRFVESPSSLLSTVPKTGYTNHPTLVADFNGDGNDDLFLVDHGLETAASGPQPGHQPKLLLSNGVGGLNDVTSTHLPTIVEFNHNGSVGDVDNDGDIDIFVAALSDIMVYLLINDGSGQFTLETDVFPADVRSFLFGPGAAQLADVNNDSRLDAVIGTYNPDTRAISICLQSESGQFLENQRIPLRTEFGDGRISQIASGDFDNDNDIDLIALTEFGTRGLMALRNDGGNFVDVTMEWLGTFRFIDSFPSEHITGLEVHDFNGDNIPDLSFAHHGMEINMLSQYILVSDGKGKLSPMPGIDIDSPVSLDGPIFVDYDTDGDIDVVGFQTYFRVSAPNVFVKSGYEIIVLENTTQ